MRVTRRFWAVCVYIAAGAGLAVLLKAPLLFGIPAALGGWLVTKQLAFVRQVERVQTKTEITQTVTPNPVLVANETALTIHVDRTNAPQPPLTLTIDTNPGLELADSATRTLPADDPTTTLTATINPPVAGSFTLNAPHITLEEATGLFTETIAVGTEPTVTVTPHVARDIHVGTGGERITLAHGTHDAERGSGGFEPGELHKYVPGDPANRIDWKATARLGEPFVRDFDPETTRQTILLLDTRPCMHTGPPGETKLDYAREIGLWIAEYTNRTNDPATMHSFNDSTINAGPTPQATDANYLHLRRRLLAIQPTPDDQPPSPTYSTPPRTAHKRTTDLDNDTFSDTLRPYFQDTTTYVQRVTDTPLFETAQRELRDVSGPTWVPIITDDSHRDELLETIKLLTDEDTHVAVFLLPTVLFEQNALTNIETTYDTYVTFEEFRQRVTNLPNTTAYEVGPRDRLETVLNAHAPRRGAHQ